MSEGFRIKLNWSRVSSDAVNKAKDIAVANISDVMNRNNGAPSGLQAMHRSGILSGSALTVRCRPGDNLMLHKALMMAAPGDVLVVDAGGCLENAIMGELMLARGTMAKIAGVVIYGAVRDIEVIAQQDTPVFAMGVSHHGPYKDGPGEIGFTISLGSMVIESGDLIVGDEDGIVAISKNNAMDVLNRASKKHDQEQEQMKQTLDGKYDGGWIDKILEAKGCSFVQ